jgi:hypothetical protein
VFPSDDARAIRPVAIAPEPIAWASARAAKRKHRETRAHRNRHSIVSKKCMHDRPLRGSEGAWADLGSRASPRARSKFALIFAAFATPAESRLSVREAT